MYGDVVHGRAESAKAKITNRLKPSSTNFKHEKYHADIVDSELTADDQKELVKRFKALVKERTGKEFPERSVGAACAARSAPCSVPG